MMKYRILIVLAVVMLLPGCFSKNVDEETYNSQSYNDCNFYDENEFFSTMPKEDETLQFENAKGVICPHHLLASGLIHDVFKAVEKNNYENVVIIGPNHNSKKGLQISLSENDWQTPFGMISRNAEYNEWLESYPYAEFDDVLMINEHSSAALVPFVKYYFPEAKISTIALPSTLTKEEAEDFGKFLFENIESENTLLIASIDFSHYLLKEEADEMDIVTLEAIKHRDLERISRLDNGYLDSPQTLIAFLIYMNGIGSVDEKLIDHLNSYDIVPVNNQGTTSYLTYVFY
ncbi:MAG: AmmeMemoRadiSam system protein B [Bacillota bacterium]|nr:AmmeMemoRadiSam system protein B [Bacillota bacterium]